MILTDNLEFLSNFYPSRIFWRGTFWPTVEHAFQAAKCKDPGDEEDIRKCKYPEQAKKLGRRVALRSDWEEVKIDIMTDLVLLKFEQNKELRKKLLETNRRYPILEEGNFWHDNFWGVCYCPECREIKGQNFLGLILMEVRDYFGEEKE